MGILCAILSLPISILLVRWLMKKKMENPFEKGEVSRLVLAGMLSMVVAAVVTLFILCVRAYRLIGIDTLKLWMSNPDPETIKNSLAEIRARSSGQTYWSAFAGTFLSVGSVEELSRFLFIRLATGKKRFAKTWLDLVICGGIVGVGFQLLEDITYVNGDLITVMLGESMILSEPDDTHLTVFNPDSQLLELIRQIASGEGLFVWKPNF